MLQSYDVQAPDDEFDDRSEEEYGFEEPEGDFDSFGGVGADDGGGSVLSWMGESSLPGSALPVSSSSPRPSVPADPGGSIEIVEVAGPGGGSLDESYSPRRSRYNERHHHHYAKGDSGSSYDDGSAFGWTMRQQQRHHHSDRPNAGICRRLGPYTVSCLALLALGIFLSSEITGKNPKELAEEAEEWVVDEWEIDFGHADEGGHHKNSKVEEGFEWDEEGIFGKHGDDGAVDAAYDGPNYGWKKSDHGGGVGVDGPASPAGDWDHIPDLNELAFDAANVAFVGADFEDGDALPAKYAGPGGGSPPLEWGNVPPETKSYAVLFDELQGEADGNDGDRRVVLSHWVAYDIPPHAHSLPGGLPNVERIEANSFGGGDGYSHMYMLQGPNSYEGEGVGYHAPDLTNGDDGAPRIGRFRLFALAGTLTHGGEGLEPQHATREEVLRRAEGVGVLGMAELSVSL